jgi:putative FmdB family regulatory protein
MPIYEYRCGACGHKLESLQRLSDAPMVTCPACGKDALTKLVSAAGFQLKGSGWYATDFKNSGAKPPAKDAAKTDAKADAAGSTSGEAKVDSAPKPDTSAPAPSAKSGESAKAETRSASDKPTSSGTTSGS